MPHIYDMRLVKVEPNCYLVEWKYKDFLRIGCEFQGATITKLERYQNLGSEYVRVVVEQPDYKI